MAAFYSLRRCLFYRCGGVLNRDRFIILFLISFLRLHLGSEIKKVVHRMTEILFAAEIAFCGLDRCMPE